MSSTTSRVPDKIVTYPWSKGLRVEEIERYYDAEGFTDYVHARPATRSSRPSTPNSSCGARESTGRTGVACADCHMPYQRVGAVKLSDHGVRSPLLNLNRACTCHSVPEAELAGRVLTIQDRHHALLQRGAKATTDMLDAIVAARKGGAADADLQSAAALHRKAQWRLDFVAAENSMGFHAPQEAGEDPRGDHRLRAPGPARGRTRRPQASVTARRGTPWA